MTFYWAVYWRRECLPLCLSECWCLFLYVCLSVCLFVCLSICLSSCPVFTSVCRQLRELFYSPTRGCVCSTGCVSVLVSVCLSVCLSTPPISRLFTCQTVSISLEYWQLLPALYPLRHGISQVLVSSPPSPASLSRLSALARPNNSKWSLNRGGH